MKCRPYRLAAVLTLAASAGCTAAPRIQDAVVTEYDGRPCFGTADPVQMPRMQAVIVSDVSQQPASTLWETTAHGAAFEPTALGCIAYGESLSGSAKAGQSAPALQPGRVYHVFLNLRRENPGDPTYGYEAEFCLKPAAGTQGMLVHQIKWDKKLKRKPYEECRAARPP